MLGSEYSIVDMAVWGWAGNLAYVLGQDDAYTRYPNIKRLNDEINARPAAERANALKARHKFKTDMDDDAKRFMFPQNERLKTA